MKLAGAPLLSIIGFALGLLLAEAGWPRTFTVPCSVILGLGLPWIVVRAVNKRHCFWFAITPDGLEAGPREFGWRAKFEEVTLIGESLIDLPGERYVEVLAGSKSATVLMTRETARECADALVAVCSCAVWTDERGNAHLPAILESAPASETGKVAARSLQVVRRRYLKACIALGIVSLLGFTGLAFVGTARAGIIEVDQRAQIGFGISSTFFSCFFGVMCFLQYRDVRVGPCMPSRYQSEC